MKTPRARAPAAPSSRDVETLRDMATALAHASDAEGVGRVVLERAFSVLAVDFAGVVLVGDDGASARGLVAREAGGDAPAWWTSLRLDLANEPSGVASAVFEAAPVAIYDLPSSAAPNDRLTGETGARSAVFCPLVHDGGVLAVLVLAAREPRAFSRAEIGLAQAVSAEAALALERVRSATALREALERERLVARISTRVRSELDVDAVMQVAVAETGVALGLARCFLRLGETAATMPVAAVWAREGARSVTEEADRLAVSNLAARTRRTVAVGDVSTAAELDDESLGGRELLLSLDARAVLATPIVVFDRMIGVLVFHRTEPGPWSTGEIALGEAIAREIGLALRTARLLDENERRIDQQTALLRAAQVVTAELRRDTLLDRLVREAARLLGVELADLYLFDADEGWLRCAAVHGFPEELVGVELAADVGVAARALRDARAVVANEYGALAPPAAADAYGSVAAAVVAPIAWGGETRGVIGVGTREPERRFDGADGDVLEAFAAIASLALRNAESFQQQIRQEQIQRGFYRIASVLGQPLSLDETLDAVAQAAAEALGGSSVAVLMPVGGRLRLRGKFALPVALSQALGRGLPADAAVLSECARERRLLASSAPQEDERFGARWRELTRRGGVSSLLAIPVDAHRSAEGGLVVVFFADPEAFTDDDLELARNLAGAARGALERSELFEAERSARALSQQLARTGSLLSTELDPGAVLDEVVEQAAALLGVDACTFRQLDGEELVVSAATGTGAVPALGERSPTTTWLAGDVVHARAPVAVVDASGDERVRSEDSVLAAGFTAYLGVPVVGPEGSLHGVLSVYAGQPREWREEEIEALVALAANASVALSNAELYQRVALERERSVAILANIADGIVAVDRDGYVVLWNEAASAITGVSSRDALGRTPTEALGRALDVDGDGAGGSRLVSIRRGSEEVWLSLSETVMRDPLGGVAGRIFAFRDVSGERIVEQMKSDFVSTVSQELRRPLTSIYGFAETLLREDVEFGAAERRTFLAYIASESERLTTIVDALLNVAQLDVGDLELHVAPTDVGTVAAEVLARVEQTGANGHRLVLELGDQPLTADADADKLRQVLLNLVDNAVKFSPDGTTVTVGARRTADAIEVRVTNEGAGIPANLRARIFTKFVRGGDEQVAGTGLGLFIARGLVAAMGGRIWVTSDEGKGSSFVFELPVARDAIAAGANG